MTRFEIRNKLIDKMKKLGYYAFEAHALSVSFTKDEYEKRYEYFDFYISVPEYNDDKFYYWKCDHGFPGAVEEYDIPITEEEQAILDEIAEDLKKVED